MRLPWGFAKIVSSDTVEISHPEYPYEFRMKLKDAKSDFHTGFGENEAVSTPV